MAFHRNEALSVLECLLSVIYFRSFFGKMIEQQAQRTDTVQWAKVIDHTRCIGCHACTTACKSENEVPLSVTRTYLEYVEAVRGEMAFRRRRVVVVGADAGEGAAGDAGLAGGAAGGGEAADAS